MRQSPPNLMGVCRWAVMLLAGLSGFEPLISSGTHCRFNQLSYRSMACMPAKPRYSPGQSLPNLIPICRWTVKPFRVALDLNQVPIDPKSIALPSELACMSVSLRESQREENSLAKLTPGLSMRCLLDATYQMLCLTVRLHQPKPMIGFEPIICVYARKSPGNLYCG